MNVKRQHEGPTDPVLNRADASGRKNILLWLLFPLVSAGVVLLHITLLRLPYFWDEGGYYIPAAWDFFRHGTLIPETTIRNAHPPVPSILLAGWWRIFGFHVVSTRIFVCLVASAALVAVFRTARLLAGQTVALTVLVLTAIYPVWFAQSTLAHADIFAAAFSLWGLSFYVDRSAWTGHPLSGKRAATAAAICFSLAALSKETAIVLPAGLFCYELWLMWQHAKAHPRSTSMTQDRFFLLATALPVLPLALWYLYHRLKTGFTFGNPEYLRYNATANLSVARVLLSLWHRLIHLTVHMNLFVPVLLTLAVLLLPRRLSKPVLGRAVSGALLTVLLVHWFAFSILGGALLTRYLLVAYPVLLLLCVVAWQSRTPWWPAIAALSLAAFAISCEVNPPYPFAPEDNLAYRDMIVLHQHAIGVLQGHYPGATVLTAWPAAAELQRPELGYVAVPFKTTEVQNFTSEQVQKAAEEPGTFDAALVFSTKYNPPPGGFNFALSNAGDSTYFDSHRDLLPGEIARALGGHVVWQQQRKGQWAAILRFDRSYDVRLTPPASRHADLRPMAYAGAKL